MNIINKIIRIIFLRLTTNRNKPDSSDITKRLIKGSFWSLVGAIVSRGLMLLASIVVARILGKQGFGEYSAIRSTVIMFMSFAGFSLGQTATRYVAEFRDKDRKKTGTIIALSGLFAFITGLLFALAVFAYAPFLADKTLNAPHLTKALKIGSLVLFLNALNGAQTGALAGFESFRKIAFINILTGIISFPMLAFGAWIDGLEGSIWALAINMGFNWLLNHLCLRSELKKHHIPFSIHKIDQEFSILWKFSLPATLSGIMVTPVIWICNAMLVHQPYGYEQMALYSASDQWKTTILFIPGMLSQVILPILSNLNGLDEKNKYIKVLKLNILVNAFISFIIATVISLFAKYIMLSYGNDYESGKNVLILLSFTSVLIAINSVIAHAIASKGLMWYGFIFNTLWAIVLLSSTYVLLNMGFGALGIALANGTAYLFHSIWQSIFLFKIINRNG